MEFYRCETCAAFLSFSRLTIFENRHITSKFAISHRYHASLSVALSLIHWRSHTHTTQKPMWSERNERQRKNRAIKKNVADDIEKQTTSNRFGYIFASSFYWLVSLFICSSSGVVLRHSVIDKQLCYSRWIVSTIKQFDDLTDLQNVIVHTIKNVSGWSARKILSHKPHNDTLPTYTTNQTQRQKTIRIDCVAILWMGAKHSR